MRHFVLKKHPPLAPATAERVMPPGAGLLIAGFGSVILYALIAGIAAIV